jgi:F-type H+-transporting ATPase subunit alpha
MKKRIFDKLGNKDRLKNLSQEEKENLKKSLYAQAFALSNQFYSTSLKDGVEGSPIIEELQHNTENSFNTKVIDILKNLDEDFKSIIVESAVPLNTKVKDQIRADLQETYGFVYPIFKLNTDLIGGIRVYLDGKLIDKSWDSYLEKFSKSLETSEVMDMESFKKYLGNLPKKFWEISQEDTEENIGIIRSFKDGVIVVEGLKNVKMSELLSVKNTNCFALVMTLNRENTFALVLSDSQEIREGMYVQSLGKMLEMPVGEDFLGRVVDSLGNAIDGQGLIRNSTFYPHEKIAPGVMTRESVKQPLQTGILAIDALIPIGKGQRELIIGDRQTGKSTIAVDTILNQRGKDVICIYVAIGQRESFVSNLFENLKRKGAMDYSIIVNASSSNSAVMQFLAPYAGVALAEFFMDQGKDVLIIYDDLSKHAVAYREVSLLLRRPPGREAYPGDIFYLHSRLLERAAKLNKDYGGGSITALPIIETQAGDVSAYIPTNVISITDGQIFLETDLFNKGILPALNVGISVSRVGGSAQTQIMKKSVGSIKLELATYYELEAFAQFSSDLDESTKKSLERGKRIVLSLNQDQNSPYSLAEEIAILFAVTNGFLDKVEVVNVATEIKGLLLDLKSNYKKLVSEIEDKKQLTDEIKADLKKVCEKYFAHVE